MGAGMGSTSATRVSRGRSQNKPAIMPRRRRRRLLLIKEMPRSTAHTLLGLIGAGDCWTLPRRWMLPAPNAWLAMLSRCRIEIKCSTTPSALRCANSFLLCVFILFCQLWLQFSGIDACDTFTSNPPADNPLLRQVLHHLSVHEHRVEALREMLRVTRDGGEGLV